MSIELAVPKPDRLADDLIAILALDDVQPGPPPSRRRRVRFPVLLAIVLAAGSAVAIFSVARLPGVGSQGERDSADRSGTPSRTEAPAERADAIVAEPASPGEARRAEAGRAIAQRPAPVRLAPSALAERRSDAVPAAPAASAREERSRASVVASRPAPAPPTAEGAAAPGRNEAAAVTPRPRAETNVAAARPDAPIAAPPEEVEVAPREASVGRAQVAAASPAAPPAAESDDGARDRRAKVPIEERKVREGVDALRLLRRQ